jgi:mannose-6-phosphate isomerase-like protein (cupin superfamily)
MSAHAPYLVKPGDGERLALRDRGAAASIKADGTRTAGGFALIETAPGPGQPGLAAHRHRCSDEALYVLDGRVRVRIGGDTVEVEAGTFVFIPRGTVHAFANAGHSQARLLVLFVPAGLEDYLRDTAAAYRSSAPTPTETSALRTRHDIEFV